MLTSKNKSRLKTITTFFIVVFFIGSILLLLQFFSKSKEACAEIFDDAYEQKATETYKYFHDIAYNYAENQHHVSNRASLTIGNIREKNNLEVLSVSDTWMKITNSETDKNNTTRWVEFSASGVYTIDMSVSEFIIDDYNNLIIVKLQTPKLSHISLCDKPKIHLYEYEKGWLSWNGNFDEGTQMSVNDHAEALSNLTDQLENNYDNLSAAKKSAENLIRAFIKNVNPDMNLKDGDIIIEYI